MCVQVMGLAALLGMPRPVSPSHSRWAKSVLRLWVDWVFDTGDSIQEAAKDPPALGLFVSCSRAGRPRFTTAPSCHFLRVPRARAASAAFFRVGSVQAKTCPWCSLSGLLGLGLALENSRCLAPSFSNSRPTLFSFPQCLRILTLGSLAVCAEGRGEF